MKGLSKLPLSIQQKIYKYHFSARVLRELKARTRFIVWWLDDRDKLFRNVRDYAKPVYNDLNHEFDGRYVYVHSNKLWNYEYKFQS